MLKKYFTSLLLMITFSFSSIAAADATALNELDKLLSSWRTFSADFSQSGIDAAGKPQQDFRGKFYLAKPNKFRWVITEPEEQMIIADGKNLWIYDQELEQVTVQPLTQQLSETPALFLSGEFTKIAQAFTVSKLQSKNNTQQYLVSPKKEDNALKEMILSFNNKNELVSMQFYDVLGQTTHLTFSNEKLNPKLSNDLFRFTPPKDVDVIGEPL